MNRKSMANRFSDAQPCDATLTVDPGICGFPCVVTACSVGKWTVTVKITGSECKQILRLAECMNTMSIQELFVPMTRNPVYIAAERAGCHTSCTIPSAVLKAVEVAMGMALPQDVFIRFEPACER